MDDLYKNAQNELCESADTSKYIEQVSIFSPVRLR